MSIQQYILSLYSPFPSYLQFLFLVFFLAVALAQPKPNLGAPTGTGPKPYVSKNPWGGLSKLQRMPGNNKGWAIKVL